MSDGTSLKLAAWASSCLFVVCFLLVNYVSFTQASCEFKPSWQGRWFQSGAQNLFLINSTYIETKGECYEESGDKYLLYDRNEDCYKCLVIHEKHPIVLQYKETYCEPKDSLAEICSKIVGDAALYSMFRKYPEVKPIACPFKSAPFIFEYNRGTGDCRNPPSRAESCTDDSRIVLKYQACPDVPSTESNVEEMVCLATWKEGSTKYLIGKVAQGSRRSLTSDEDQYRCFVYQRGIEYEKTVYYVAQSGDATCAGLQSPTEGSRTMKLTIVDDQHKRCKFPVWITEHHTWFSLDHHKTFKFSQRNATLKIFNDENANPIIIHQTLAQPQFGFENLGFESQDQKRPNSELRLVCHAILEQQENKKVEIVAHVTAGCDSGYVCMIFYKRDSHVIEVQQSENYVENPDDACANFDPAIVPYTTLVTTTFPPKRCPHLGRYAVSPLNGYQDKRKRRELPVDVRSIKNPVPEPEPECISQGFESLLVGCNEYHQMEFISTCPGQPTDSYACHGSWEENGISYIITTPNSLPKKQTNLSRYCFMLQLSNKLQQVIIEGELGKGVGMPILKMSQVSDSCDRRITPGADGRWAFNFTNNGSCDHSMASTGNILLIPAVVLTVISSLSVLLYVR